MTIIKHRTQTFSKIFAEWPCYFRYYFIFLLTVGFLFTFWFPMNDFDSISTHLSRIKFEEFGPLQETGTSEFQIIFPKFFDYLHSFFLKWGYFQALPNFLFFLGAMIVLAFYLPFEVVAICILLFYAAQPLIVQMTSQKSDAALGYMSLFAVLFISKSKNTYYFLAFSCILLAALVGFKWHGFFVALPLTLALIAKLRGTHRPTLLSALFLALALPIIYYVSSFDIYFSNVINFGTLFPQNNCLGDLAQSKHISAILINLYRVLATHFFDTFDNIFLIIDHFAGGVILPILNTLTLNAKITRYTSAPHPEFVGFGGLFVIGFLVAMWTLLKTKDLAVRICAATGLAYFFLTAATIHHNSFLTRYYCTSYVLFCVPLAYWVKSLRNKIWIPCLTIYAMLVSAPAMFLQQQRSFFAFSVYTVAKNKIVIPSIMTNPRSGNISLFHRESLYYSTWRNHWPTHQEITKTIGLSKSLAFVNQPNICGQIPFIYPFIRHRSPANTAMFNLPHDQILPKAKLKGYDFVLAFVGENGPRPDTAMAEIGYTRVNSFNNELHLYSKP